MACPFKVKIRIDYDLCQGHARCAALAPELFASDESGFARVLHDGPVPDGLLRKAHLAKGNCPEIAIFIEKIEG